MSQINFKYCEKSQNEQGDITNFSVV